MIDNEMARRMARPSPGSIPTAAGIRYTAPPPAQTPAWANAVMAIPRVGAFVRGLNAGPVADGTLDYARSQGWVK